MVGVSGVVAPVVDVVAAVLNCWSISDSLSSCVLSAIELLRVLISSESEPSKLVSLPQDSFEF